MAAATLALAPTPAVLDGERSIEDPKSMIHRREGATPARRKAWRANLALLASAAAAGCAADAYYQAAQDLQVQNPHAALEYVARCLETDPNHQMGRRLVSEKILKMIAMEHEAKVEALVAAGNVGRMRGRAV